MQFDEKNISIDRILQRAAEQLSAGQLQQAEALVRKVLQTHPDHHKALNLLGVIALNSGHAPQAVDIFSRVVQLHGAEAEYQCNLGVALLATGHPDKGEAALLAALALMPSHPMANFNMGLRDLQLTRFEDARHHLGKAVKKMPQNVAVLNALGVAYSKCGKPVKAVSLFRSVLKFQPNHIEGQLNLAGALTEMGKTNEAVELYEQLIEMRPDQASLFFNLGIALRKARRPLDAINAYERAIVLGPDFVDAHVNLSSLYAGRGNQGGALKYVRSARLLRPDDHLIMINEARVLRDAGLVEEALAACERILTDRPDNADALGVQITILQNDGRFAEARVLGAECDTVPALLALSLDKHYAFSDANIQLLKGAAMNSGADVEGAARAWFALGKIHHDRSDYVSAFDFYKRGNALCDGMYEWSSTDEQSLFANLTETFLERRSGLSQHDDAPVFIVGMPRSGTTLVEQVLASHPNAEGGGELADIQVMVDTLAKTLGSSKPYPACVSELDATTATNLSEKYLEHLTEISGTATHVTNKTPDNYLHLGLIALLFPKARIIHCRRNAMATCFSIYQQNFEGYHPYAYDLEKIGRRYQNYERLMEHWGAVLALPMLEVVYEDFVANQEGQSRRILEFCDLDWDEGVLNFHQAKRNVQTASLWQVRQPIYASALKNWHSYEAFLDPLKKVLGES